MDVIAHMIQYIINRKEINKKEHAPKILSATRKLVARMAQQCPSAKILTARHIVPTQRSKLCCITFAFPFYL